MADVYIDWCPKCESRPEIVKENGNVLIRCIKCDYTVTICEEKELSTDYLGRKTVVPPGKGMAAIRKWNAKEEVNGR